MTEQHAYRSVRLAVVGDKGISGTQAALQQLYPAVEFVAPAAAEVIGFNMFPAQPLESKADVKERIAHAAAQLQTVTTEIVAVCDSVEAVAAVQQAQAGVTKLATTYGVSADWHLAITTATLQRVGFVLQGPEDAYFRGAVLSAAKFHAQNLALALVMLLRAGVPAPHLQQQLPRAGVVLETSYQVAQPSVCEQYQGQQLHWFLDSGSSAAATDAVLGELTEAAPEAVWAIVAPAAVQTSVVAQAPAGGGSATTPQQDAAAIRNELLRGAYYGHSCGRVIVVDPAASQATSNSGTIQQQSALLQGIAQANGKARLAEVSDLTAALQMVAAQADPATTVLVSGCLAEPAAKILAGEK